MQKHETIMFWISNHQKWFEMILVIWDDIPWDFIPKPNILNYIHIRTGSSQTY
jgi:hypothetical protein